MLKIPLKFVLLTVFVMSLVTVIPANAQTNVIDFEKVVNDQPVTNQYPDITVSSAYLMGYEYRNANNIINPRWTQFPPHSGNKAVYLPYFPCKIDFKDPVSKVGIWYTSPSVSPLLLALNANGGVINSVSGPTNSGSSQHLVVSGTDIKSVLIISGNIMTLDDLEYDTPDAPSTPPTGIPEFPSVALPVVAILGLMLVFQRKK